MNEPILNSCLSSSSHSNNLNINNHAESRTKCFNISDYESSDDWYEEDEDFNPQILNMLQHKHQSLEEYDKQSLLRHEQADILSKIKE